MKRLIMTALAIMSVISLTAQVDDDWSNKIRESQENARREYEAFRQQAMNDYEGFRRKANEEYATFMEEAWTSFLVNPGEEIPWKPKPVEPVVVQQNPDLTSDPIEFDGKPIRPKPLESPEPITPIKPIPRPSDPVLTVGFYGTDILFHYNPSHAIHLKDASEKSVASLWRQLSDAYFDNLLAECLRHREELNLCDWGYVMLTEQVAEAICGGHTNESVVLHMFLLTQSGYQMRLARAENHLCVLVGSQEKIYHYKFFRIDGIKYFLFDLSLEGKKFHVFNHSFPKEKLMSLEMKQPKLKVVETRPRHIASHRFPKAEATVVLNQNLIDFYNGCPITSKWVNYSKASLSDMVKDSLYPVLRKVIAGKFETEAANILLDFVQTGFKYATDQEQFGYERPMFPDESLYYPYNDCEDRAIFYSCLVRELMGLEVVLLDYPDHLATAVCFKGKVAGDFVEVDGKRFVVCDPTYIGAGLGLSMPAYKTAKPNVWAF